MDAKSIWEILGHLGKVFLYLAGSVLVGVLLSPEFKDWVENYPELVALAPVINLVAVALAQIIQKFLPKK